MIKNHLVITVCSSVLLLFFGCAFTKLADYQTKSAEEKEVLDLLVKCEETYNKRNLAKHMAYYHNNATIKIDQAGEYQPIVSKQQYEAHLKSGGWAQTEINLVNPYITIMGDRATIRCTDYSQSFIIRHKINMIKESEKWSINRWDWEWR